MALKQIEDNYNRRVTESNGWPQRRFLTSLIGKTVLISMRAAEDVTYRGTLRSVDQDGLLIENASGNFVLVFTGAVESIMELRT